MNNETILLAPDLARFRMEKEEIVKTLNESGMHLRKMEAMLADLREFNRKAKEYLKNSSQPSLKNDLGK